VPFAFRGEVEQEIAKLEQEGVITKVDNNNNSNFYFTVGKNIIVWLHHF
jgi:hypothetical protein